MNGDPDVVLDKKIAAARMHLDVKRAQWGAAEVDGRAVEAEAYAAQVGDLLGSVHTIEAIARRLRIFYVTKDQRVAG